MDENNNNVGYFFLGLGLGVAAGLLFAPKAGAETRDLLMSKADQGREYLRRQSEGLRDQAGDLVDRGRDLVSKQKDTLNQAVEAGKQAYREAVGGAQQQTGTSQA